VRTSQPYGSLEDVIDIHLRVGKMFDRLGRDRHVLLVDMRRAPVNNHPDFERASARARAILVRGFPRIAVLVQTAVGALQIRRHLREDNIAGDVFHEESDALTYLTSADSDLAPPSGVGHVNEGPFGHLSRLGSKR